MAKRSNKSKLQDTSALNTNGNGQPVVSDVSEAKEFAIELRSAYYQTFNKQCLLDLDETEALVKANVSDQPMAAEWWFAKMKEGEHAKNMKAASRFVGVDRELLDQLNADGGLQDFALKVVEAKDLPSKAPATIALRLIRDVKPKQLATFAVPYSKQAERKDGDGKVLNDNEIPGYRWDYYDTEDQTGATLKGSYYLNLVDGTKAGIQLKDYITKLSKETEHTKACPVNIDGVVLDVATMQPQQRDAFKQMFDGRRNALATAYRKAVQIIQMMDEIHSRCSNQYDDKGNLIKVGAVACEFVYLDMSNPDMGLSPSKTPIRMHALLQQDITEERNGKTVVLRRAGDFSGEYKDMLVSEFINISIDGAIELAAKAGKDHATFTELKTARKVKKQATAAGDKKDEDKAKATISMNALPQYLQGVRLAGERPDNAALKAWLDMVSNKPVDEMRMIAYDLGETIMFLNQLYNKPMQEAHDEIVDERNVAVRKELEDKQRQMMNK